MVATTTDGCREILEVDLKLTGGLSAEEADRRIATAIRAGDVGARV